MAKITVLTTDINVVSINNEDYICITDMLKAKDGDFFISDWLRNRNTLEYLGIWERLYNPGFNYGEFATIRNQSGLNSFKISVKEYVEKPMLSVFKRKPEDMEAPMHTRTSHLNLECGLVLNLKSI